MSEPEYRKEFCELLSSANDSAVAHMLSQQLWLPTQDLQKIKPIKTPMMCGGSQGSHPN